MRGWYPHRTRDHYGPPEPGMLLAYKHAVWRVEKVIAPVELDSAAREVWVESGMPDLATWPGRPYTLNVVLVGGQRPKGWPETGVKAAMNVPARRFPGHWAVYHGDRWPQCSCCGEPMPCQAELQDRYIDASLEQVAKFESRMPGCCWACGEPISRRQKSITYPGDNADLPGGMPAAFHMRSSCCRSAHYYEERWVAADPRRERILTYPQCGGTLIVHGDGSSECIANQAPIGGLDTTVPPDCRGHLTHDHRHLQACCVGATRDIFGDRPAGPRGEFPGCPRGCSPEGHPGAQPGPRPERRTPTLGALPLDEEVGR